MSIHKLGLGLTELKLLWLRRMFRLGCGVGPLMAVGGGGQSLGRTGGIGLLLGRSVGRMVVGQILGGQIHIRRVIIFLHLGLFGAVRMIRLLELRRGLL